MKRREEKAETNVDKLTDERKSISHSKKRLDEITGMGAELWNGTGTRFCL